MRLIFLSAFIVSAAALAQPSHRGPPAESLAACNGLSEGTACGFTHNGQNLTGTCRNGPNGQTAACLPEGGPGGRGQHRGPPQEAISACSSQSAGATCSFTHGDRTVEGTCRTGPQGDTLACAPAGGPGGHHRGPPQEAPHRVRVVERRRVVQRVVPRQVVDRHVRHGPRLAAGLPPGAPRVTALARASW